MTHLKMLIALFILMLPASAAAHGMYSCDPVPEHEWLTEAQLTQDISDDGWSVRWMRQDGGCWEVYGRMPDGKRVEAYFHPSTGELLLISQRGKILYEK